MSPIGSNVTAKMPITARSENPGSGERVSVRLDTGAPFPPRVIGRYLLCDVFAAGGMATLHLGRLMGPEGFSRTVAIKQLHPQFAHDPKFVAMFLDEARLASRVHHPNVVSPLDVISNPPDLYMVMDYVHGESLSRLLRRRLREPVLPRIAAAIVGQMLLGLHAAHEAVGESGERLELVHRDVSPHNVLVTKDGVARLVDFGIAKAKARSQQTERGMLKGKLGYMAPEQLSFDAVDRRADIFAVGVVLWEMLTGQRLFEGETPQIVLQKLMERPIPPPSSLAPGLPAGLDHVVLAALSRDPSERFDNARAMAQALDYSLSPASMLELSAWVEARVGAELSARAEQVLDVESLSFDDFTRSVRHPLMPAATATAPVASSVPPTPAPVASPVVVPPVRPRNRRVLAFGLLALAAGALGAAGWVGWRATHVSAPSVGAPTLVVLPPPPKTEGTLSPPPPPAEAAPVEGSSPSLPSVVANVKRTLPPKVAVTPPLASAPASSRPKPAPGPCDVPYVVDKNGVKRFKEACF